MSSKGTRRAPGSARAQISSRREFGTHILQLAAVLGLRTVSASSVLGATVLGACGEAGSRTQPEPDAGGVQPVADGSAPMPALDGSAPPSVADGSAPTEEVDAGVKQVVDAAGETDGGNKQAPRVIIVGSGYGAAVTALRLTERGIPVTMLEMGRLWDKPGPDGKKFCTPFQPDGRAMWFEKKTRAVIKTVGGFINTAFDVPMQAGILGVKGNEQMDAYVGRGVGGGSLVNLAIYVEPQRNVFKQAFPEVDADSMYKTYYPRAKAMLKAAEVPGSIVFNAEGYQYARVGRAAAEKVGIAVSLCTSGYDYDYMAKEIAGTVPKSAMGGEAGFGNNYGKRSLDQTYIADAMGTGLLTIMSLTEVRKITRDPSGEYVVHCKQIDIDGKVLAEPELRCTHLFLGAGSFGTSELLVRARETGALPDLNPSVGTKWGPNSDIFVGRSNPIWQPTGATQAGVPGMAFHTRDQDDKTVFSMIIPFPAGIETFFSFNIVMTENPEHGSFYFDASTDSVRLRWDVAQNKPAVKSSRHVFDKINVASGTSYSGDFGGAELGDNSTYHPVGGCPLSSATDAYGRVRPYQGLYVMDSSLIPVGIGANPALTVTALAERNVERILQEDLGIG